MAKRKTSFNHELSLKVTSLALGSFSAVAYVTCVAYGMYKSNPLHHQIFELLPWFKWLDVTNFLIGLVDVFLIGAFYGAVFVLIYNYFVRKYG